MERIDGNKVPERILSHKPEGTRPLGHPRQRWMVEVEINLLSMGVQNKKHLASLREEWQKFVVITSCGTRKDDYAQITK